MNYAELLADARRRVREQMPWDVLERMSTEQPPLLLDVREPHEFERVRIAGSINVPRGILEQACEWDQDDTVPTLAGGRQQAIVVVCRSGNRSLLAADTLRVLGFTDVVSLATGLRGWNDAEQPLVDAAGQPVDADTAEPMLASRVRPDQRRPG